MTNELCTETSNYMLQLLSGDNILTRCVFCVCMNICKQLPMQIRPVRSSTLPGEHTHEKEPALFLHTPLIHGLLSHSFRSETKEHYTDSSIIHDSVCTQ